MRTSLQGIVLSLRGFVCLLLIVGLLVMSGCGSCVMPSHVSPGDNILEPAGARASQTFEGAEVVLVTAAVATVVLLALAALAIYFGLGLAEG